MIEFYFSSFRWRQDGNALATVKTLRGFRSRIVHRDQILGDELLYTGTAGFRQVPNQKLVQPFAGIVGCGGNQDRKLRHVGAGVPPVRVRGEDDFRDGKQINLTRRMCRDG